MPSETARKYSENITQKLYETLHDEKFIEGNKVGQADFTRERKLTFSNLCIFLMRGLRSSYQCELDRFFERLEGKQGVSVSKSAFTQARGKVKYGAFTELGQTLLEDYYRRPETREKWKGHRVVAIDGGTFRALQAQ